MSLNTIALGQIDTIVGNFEHNKEKIIDYGKRARDQGADIVCFPELSVCGYPPLDLLERPSFLEANLRTVEEIAQELDSLDVIVGYAQPNTGDVGKHAFNAAALLRDGSIHSRHYKNLLPTYDVFNEARYFEPASEVRQAELNDASAITICEDIWNDPQHGGSFDQPRYRMNPLDRVDSFHPEFVFNISASPFIRGKDRARGRMIQELAEKYGTTFVVCNQVGGNDSLIFDGNSMVVDGSGNVLGKARSFEEDLLVVDLESDEPIEPNYPSEPEGVYEALKLGLRDYMQKCGFDEVLLGLSGGIDSSLTATIAVDALGADNVLGVLMPSEITSEQSVTDAEELADNLGIETREFPIKELFDEYLSLFEEEFEGLEWDHTEENLQARIRGNILMALSNKYGHLLLSTGNKSELAVGYCTLYGDMNGGLAIIADVPKTMVYELSEYRNQIGRVIPQSVIEKPPSAELAPGQEDQDELPPYEVLDEVIERYVGAKESRRSIIEAGFPEDVVNEIVRLIDLNEYKRQQAAPNLKVTSKSFGTGRNMPIAQHFDS